MLSKLFSRSNDNGHQEVIIVSGLPRSGTSMMMKMLESGGVVCLTDEIRKADEDNPKGYYEFERVKKLKDGDRDWLPEARGKAVKIISALLTELPPDYNYKLIFMQREMEEVLASQREMLLHRGENPDQVSDEEIAGMLSKHLQYTFNWLDKQPNIETMRVNYNGLLKEPKMQIEQINQFLGNRLNTEKMVDVVDLRLYRNRQDKA